MCDLRLVSGHLVWVRPLSEIGGAKAIDPFVYHCGLPSAFMGMGANICRNARCDWRRNESRSSLSGKRAEESWRSERRAG